MKPALPWWRTERVKAGLLSLLILAVILGVWHLATLPKAAVASSGPALTPEQIEYLQLMGKDPGAPADAGAGTSGFPTLAQMGHTVREHLSQPFYDKGPNDKGVGLQLMHSLGRVGAAAGRITSKAVRQGETSSVRATLSQSRRTPATPKAVLISMGQIEQMKITKMPDKAASLMV